MFKINKSKETDEKNHRRGVISINALPFVIVVPLIVYAIISHCVIVERFEKQEAAERARDIHICYSILDERCEAILSTLLDYAIWDQTYEVAKSHRPSQTWLDENLIRSVPEHYGYEVVLLTDLQSNIIASTGLEPDLKTVLFSGDHIKQAINGKKAASFIRVRDELYMVAMSPVLDSSGNSKSAGSLTFAKKIDNKILEDIAETVNLDLVIFTGSNVAATTLKKKPHLYPDNPGEMYQECINTKNNVVQLSDNEQNIYVWRCIGNWDGSPVATLTTCTPRTMVLGNIRGAGLRSIILVVSCLLAALLATLQMRSSTLARHALVDELTGLNNHRYLQERLVQEMTRSKRYGRPLSIALLDIDHFKHINDEYGHLIGDQALKHLAQLLRETVRETDVIARYGGEEFMIIMPETRLRAAMEAAERIRKQVEESSFDAKIAGSAGRGSSRLKLKFTISIGVASFPTHAVRGDELIMAADLALFAAKHASRNAVRSYNAIIDQDAIQNEGPVTIHLAMREGSLSAVRALAAAVDARDPQMRGHSEKVALCALAIGQAVGLSDEDMNTLRTAALLHDVGRVAVPDAVLGKADVLSEEELAIVRSHSAIGADILSKAPQLAQVAELVRHHHERYDGSGYPDGLEGENIPLASRIIATADAFDAMTSERAYRCAFVPSQVVDRMRELAGKQFDPHLIDVLEELVESGKLSALLESYRRDLGRAA